MTKRLVPPLRPVYHHSKRLALVVLVSMMLMTPLGTTAQDSTPSSADGSANATPLASLLSLVPREIESLDAPDDFFVYYSNFRAQLDALGIEPPDADDHEGLSAWQETVASSMLPPSDSATYLPSWREDYGFDLLQADQTLEAGMTPHGFSLFRGGFDEQAIIQALGRLGYEPVGTGEPTILSIRDDYAIDIGAPTAYKLAQMNFATILDDGTLVFAPALGIIESVVDVAQGNAPSFAERPEIAALVATSPDNLASALIVGGIHLAGGDVGALILAEGTPDLDALATRVIEEGESRQEMPPIRHVLLGVTSGWAPAPEQEWADAPDDVPLARNVAIAHMYQATDVQTAVPVIEERLATQTPPMSDTPFIEMYPDWTVEAVDGEPLVVVDLTLGDQTTPRDMYNLLLTRGLSFLGW